MPDALWFVFGPGAAATLAALATPLGFALRARYRRRAAERNRRGACGHCGTEFFGRADSELFLVEGRYICDRCAPVLKRRLAVLLPAVGGLALIAAASSIYGAVAGGPGLDWWLSSRLIPLLLPAVGLGVGLVGGVRLMKRLNRRELEHRDDGQDVPPHSASAAKVLPARPAERLLPPPTGQSDLDFGWRLASR